MLVRYGIILTYYDQIIFNKFHYGLEKNVSHIWSFAKVGTLLNTNLTKNAAKWGQRLPAGTIGAPRCVRCMEKHSRVQVIAMFVRSVVNHSRVEVISTTTESHFNVPPQVC